VQTGDHDNPVVETRRTDKKAAENDVQILKEIVRRHAWIQEQ
jgi:hypothetical protein